MYFMSTIAENKCTHYKYSHSDGLVQTPILTSTHT